MIAVSCTFAIKYEFKVQVTTTGALNSRKPILLYEKAYTNITSYICMPKLCKTFFFLEGANNMENCDK